MDDTGPITSRENRRLVAVRKIRDGKDRALIFIEGARLSEEAIRSGVVVEDCLVSASFEDNELLASLTKQPIVIADRLFASVADTESPQGIIITAKKPEHDLSSIENRLRKPGGISLVLFLSEVNNPANLGAVVRAAEAAGAAGIVTSSGSANAYSPKALRASMGSAFRLPIVENVDADEAAAWAREIGLRTIAVDIDGECSHTENDWNAPTLLIFGSEAHGLEPAQVAAADVRVVIEMEPAVESLNLAVSAGIILFEARRQSRSRP
jgi:RNA methyltransferase, TrmH family